MSGSSKQKGPLWYGYLEAGDKSTPVVRDERLDTGSAKTLFLFNLARRQILEYTREIVEPKLRELKPGEAKHIDEEADGGVVVGDDEGDQLEEGHVMPRERVVWAGDHQFPADNVE